MQKIRYLFLLLGLACCAAPAAAAPISINLTIPVYPELGVREEDQALPRAPQRGEAEPKNIERRNTEPRNSESRNTGAKNTDLRNTGQQKSRRNILQSSDDLAIPRSPNPSPRGRDEAQRPTPSAQDHPEFQDRVTQPTERDPREQGAPKASGREDRPPSNEASREARPQRNSTREQEQVRDRND